MAKHRHPNLVYCLNPKCKEDDCKRYQSFVNEEQFTPAFGWDILDDEDKYISRTQPPNTVSVGARRRAG